VVIKGFRNLDIAAFVTAWAVQFVAYALITRMGGDQLPVLSLAALALYQVFQLLLLIYSGALIIVIVISWVAPGSYNPMAELLGQVTEPLLAPVRRFIPPVGGLDFSVMVVLLVLMLIRNYLLPAILLSLFQ
jgi:YggT family protein